MVDLLDVFCGHAQPGCLMDAVANGGGTALGVDIIIGGAAHDLLVDSVYASLCDAITSGRMHVRFMWLGIVCSSFSVLWLKPDRPRLRSRTQPDGILPPPSGWEGYTRRHNLLVERGATLAFLVWEAGGTFIIENPPDYGWRKSPHFRWQARAHVPLWLTSWMRHLATLTNPAWATTALGGWGSPYHKLTQLMAAGPDKSCIESSNLVQAGEADSFIPADGVDVNGNQHSKLAGAYPPLFCAFFGFNIMKGRPYEWAHAPAAAALTLASMRLLDSIRRQRAAGHDRIARLAATAPMQRLPTACCQARFASCIVCGGSMCSRCGSPAAHPAIVLCVGNCVAPSAAAPEGQAQPAALVRRPHPSAPQPHDEALRHHNEALRHVAEGRAAAGQALLSLQSAAAPSQPSQKPSAAEQAAAFVLIALWGQALLDMRSLGLLRAQLGEPPIEHVATQRQLLRSLGHLNAQRATFRAIRATMALSIDPTLTVKAASFAFDSARSSFTNMRVCVIERMRRASDCLAVAASNPVGPAATAQTAPTPAIISSAAQQGWRAFEGWRSGHRLIPSGWHEHADVEGAAYQEARRHPLNYVSRRRAEPEADAELQHRPMPQPSVAPATRASTTYGPVAWPHSCPPRPIHISQLFDEGVYGTILESVDAVAAQCAAGAAGRKAPKVASRVFPPELQPEWARQCSWDTKDPFDCVPLQPSTDTPPQGAVPSFFTDWGEKLEWPDRDMIAQVAAGGIEGRSACTRATIVQGHHGGLRDNFKSAQASIDADTALGFMSEGRRDLWIVPSIMVAKNCVPRRQWKLSESGLQRTLKWRVTTDDSISVEGETSRNDGMDRREWARAGLPSARTLGELVAVTRSMCAQSNYAPSQSALERIALWAFDLTHAYRELAIQRAEQGQQCFVWTDGVRLDFRCVFGAAHMVDLFQRVTTFVMAVARFRIREYERQHPFSAAREAWLEWRAAHCGLDEGGGQSIIYLDDGLGLSILDPGEPLEGRSDFSTRPASARLGVEPGGRVRLDVFTNLSRAQTDLAIMRATFSEAGWGIAVDKVQLGWAIDELGITCSTLGDGALLVPEAKRQGMLVEISEQQDPSSLPRELRRRDGRVPLEAVEGLTGRCLHLAMVAPEANPYLQPMYAVKHSTVTSRRGRFRPSAVSVLGEKPQQLAYQSSLAYWKHALEAGISTPLAPRLTFPSLDSAGSAFMFTDAAREDGTGHGAFTFIAHSESAAQFLYIDPRWPPDVILALQQDTLSMPAGEGLGAVIFADILATALPGLTHLVIFTDSSAVAVAIQANGSPSPQMNLLVRWLFERHPHVQFLALHQPGVRNDAADGLSRSRSAAVIADAVATGAHAVQLHVPPHAVALMRAAMATPQRTRPHPSQAP